MKIKVEELVAVNLELKGNIGILEERIAKEESDKLVRLSDEKYMNLS